MELRFLRVGVDHILWAAGSRNALDAREVVRKMRPVSQMRRLPGPIDPRQAPLADDRPALCGSQRTTQSTSPGFAPPALLCEPVVENDGGGVNCSPGLAGRMIGGC